MRFEARDNVQIELEKQGLYKEKMPHATRLDRGEKTGDIIKPLMKP